MIFQEHPHVKSRLPYFILTLFTLFFLLSCKGPKTAAQDDLLPQALLWKIEHKNLPRPSYLFGTIHMIPSEDYFLPAGFEEAFNHAEEVVFEIDLDDMSDIGSLMGMITQLMMKDGMTLQQILSPDEYKEVADYFEDMGLPMFLLNRVKPMFLSMLAEVNMDPSAMQSDEIVSYEMELYDKANEMSKDVGGLETMAYQMSLFDSIPYADQAAMLLETVRGVSLDSDVFDQTVALYTLQDIEGMVAMIGESEADDTTSHFENVLLVNRNQNWISVMTNKMASHPVFFAVGAGHLGGPQGVIRLLRKAGYQLTPVSIYKPKTANRI